MANRSRGRTDVGHRTDGDECYDEDEEERRELHGFRFRTVVSGWGLGSLLVCCSPGGTGLYPSTRPSRLLGSREAHSSDAVHMDGMRFVKASGMRAYGVGVVSTQIAARKALLSCKCLSSKRDT